MFKSFKEKLSNFFKSSDKPEEKKTKRKKEKKKSAEEEKEEKKKQKEEIKEKEKKPEKKQENKKELIEKPKTKPSSKTSAQHPATQSALQIQEQKKQKKVQEKIEETKQEINYLVDKVEEKVEEKIPEESKGIFGKIKTHFTSVTIDQKTFNEFFEKLEMLLLENNVALSVVDKIREDMEKKLINMEIKKSDIEEEIKSALKESVSNILIEPFDFIEKIKKSDSPFVILFFGINGSGKTTIIAKIANLLKENNIQSIFAAADTFRAASIEQIIKHGEKLGIKVIHQIYGSDPAAVGFDAIQYAKSHGIKVVLIDTAGRMHTRDNLLKEMEKIVRVTQPNLKIFVAESITGNDATEQAKAFNESFQIDATILTKADVDEKGGTAISIGHVTKKPIIFLGTGQEYKDLEKFDAKEILVRLGLN